MYKQNETTYAYVSSRIPISVLEYGEQTTLETTNSVLDDKEAYWNARHNDKYNGEQTYTFTITVPNYPLLKIGDLVQVTANAKKLNTVKRVKSIKISFDMSHMPRVQTEIGLDELAPDLQLKENIRNLRRNAKAKSTDIGSSAVPVSKVELYRWDR